jgi:hypothetical protein
MLKKICLFITLIFVTQTALCRDWISYTSQNFTIYSDQKPKEAIALLKEFEIFRGVALFVTGLPNKPENSKMKILVYAKAREYNKIGPPNTAGFYTDTSDGPRMIVGPDRRSMDKTVILYHEYIHYLVREHSRVIYPRWYNEGFAEVLGATTIKRGKATVGVAPESRLITINYDSPFKVRDLLQPDEERSDSRYYQSRFYAYAWLLTHYLQISSLGDNTHLKAQNQDFLLRYNQGENPVQAFEASFKMTPEEMDTELRNYRSQRQITVLTMSVPDYEGDITQSELSANEQTFLLADLAWRVGKEDVALKYLEDIDTKQANAARPLSLAAVLENHKDNTEKAATYADQALALGSDDSKVMTNLSHWQWDNFDRARKVDLETSTFLNDTLVYGEKAIQLDPTNLEAHHFVWESQMENGDDAATARTMMAAYQLSPSNLGINLTIGRFLLSIQKPELARPFLERVLNWSHSEEQRTAIQAVLDRIDKVSGIETASGESADTNDETAP